MKPAMHGCEPCTTMMPTAEMASAMSSAEMTATMCGEVAAAVSTAMTAATMASAVAALAERGTRYARREQQGDDCEVGFRHARLDGAGARYAVRFGPIASNWAFCSSLSVA